MYTEHAILNKKFRKNIYLLDFQCDLQNIYTGREKIVRHQYGRTYLPSHCSITVLIDVNYFNIKINC